MLFLARQEASRFIFTSPIPLEDKRVIASTEWEHPRAAKAIPTLKNLNFFTANFSLYCSDVTLLKLRKDLLKVSFYIFREIQYLFPESQ
jgi:hypothetical protein